MTMECRYLTPFVPHKGDGLPYKVCSIYDVIVVHDLMHPVNYTTNLYIGLWCVHITHITNGTTYVRTFL